MAKSLNDVRLESIKVWAVAQRKQQQERDKYPNFIFEEKSNENENVAAAASGTGSGGSSVQVSPNSNTLPPSVVGYVPFEQSIFMIMSPNSNQGNLVYQSYNYTTDTLSEPQDSGRNEDDWDLYEYYPSNDGYVLLMWRHTISGAIDRVIEYVAPTGTVAWSRTFADFTNVNYYMGGLEEDGQSSPLYFYSIEPVTGGYDITVDYLYQGLHYSIIENDVTNNNVWNQFESLGRSISGQAIFRVSLVAGVYKYYSIGPSGTVLIDTRPAGETTYFDTAYPYYTKDLKWAYSYQGYKTDFFFMAKMYFDTGAARYLINDSYKIYKNLTTPDWDAYDVINTRIGELETGATFSDCYITESITEGIHLYHEIRNAITDSKYLFVLNLQTKTITSAMLWTYGNNIDVHDMLNGTVILKGYDNFIDYDNDFDYYDNLAVVMMWSDNTVESVLYGDETRIQSADLNKAGNIATWFTKPAAGGQISIVKKTKGGGTITIPVPGFTQATDDQNVEFYYEWCWDINLERPYYILYRKDGTEWTTASPLYKYDLLGINIDGSFNIANKLSVTAEYSNARVGNGWVYGSHYGFEKNGILEWYTMNPVTRIWTKQLTMSSNDWTTSNISYASYGFAGQKFILYDYVTGSAYIFKASGITASATFGQVQGSSIGYTYCDNFAPDDGSDNWYIVDTENLTIKQIYNGDYACDGYDVIDRNWYFRCEGPGYTDLVNGSITRTIAGYYPWEPIHNDIYRWND